MPVDSIAHGEGVALTALLKLNNQQALAVEAFTKKHLNFTDSVKHVVPNAASRIQLIKESRAAYEATLQLIFTTDQYQGYLAETERRKAAFKQKRAG
ncbi:hypothetical protein FLA_3794 [Filimonas lacunae]|nr:hypothetical protein FLA_3794 [Filimonas lacunae]